MNLADALLRTCSKIRLLATSREPLEVAKRAPVSRPVSGLLPTAHQLAGGQETLRTCEAVRLFVDRATAHRSQAFRLDESTGGAVVSICLNSWTVYPWLSTGRSAAPVANDHRH